MYVDLHAKLLNMNDNYVCNTVCSCLCATSATSLKVIPQIRTQYTDFLSVNINIAARLPTMFLNHLFFEPVISAVT